MFERRKMLDIFLISLLLSVALCVSLFNFLSEKAENESFASTFIFIVIWGLAVFAAYLFGHRAVTFFVFGYLLFVAVCIVILLAASVLEASGNAFLALCSLFAAVLGGFYCISGLGSVIALVFAVAGAAISFFLSVKMKKNN